MKNKIIWVLLISVVFALYSLSANAISVKEVNQKFDTPKYKNLAVYSKRALMPEDFENTSKPKVLVSFASWCPTCKNYIEELNVISKKSDIDIWGIAVSDNPSAVRDLLDSQGSPFSFVNVDKKGKTLLQNSSYRSIPQTFLIDKKGNVRYILIGDLDLDDWNEELLPRYNELNRE